MTYDERTVVHRDEAVDGPVTAPATDHSTAVTSRTVEMRPSGGTIAGRIVVFIFGVDPGVHPPADRPAPDGRPRGQRPGVVHPQHEPDLRRARSRASCEPRRSRPAGSVFDLAAVLALVGWTILEAIILAAVGVFRREPA